MAVGTPPGGNRGVAPTQGADRTFASTADEKLTVWTGFVKCWKEYATFDGRARRTEYWGFWLFMVLFGIPLAVVPYGQFLWNCATLVPFLAVTWRRYHDTGRSGATFLFPAAVIALGGVIMIVAMGMGFLAAIGTNDADRAMNAIRGSLGPAALGGFIAFLGALQHIVWLCEDSEPGENEYGPNPKWL